MAADSRIIILGRDPSGKYIPLTLDASGNLLADVAVGSFSLADGADVAEGATTDAAATAGGVGTISAKLRLITTLLDQIRELEAASTAITSAVADNAASVTLISANASRVGVTVRNDSTVDLYLKCGTLASLTDYTVVIPSGGYWESPYKYLGRIDGIWASDPNTGSARITEFV